jgi:hypothetical protein
VETIDHSRGAVKSKGTNRARTRRRRIARTTTTKGSSAKR